MPSSLSLSRDFTWCTEKHYERRVFCGIQRDEFACRRNGERRVIRRKAKIIISQGRKSEGSTPTNNQWFLCFFRLLLAFILSSFSENIGHHTNPQPYTHRNPIIFPQLLLLQFFRFSSFSTFSSFVSIFLFFERTMNFLRSMPAISIRHKIEKCGNRRAGRDSEVMSCDKSFDCWKLLLDLITKTPWKFFSSASPMTQYPLGNLFVGK